MYSDLKLVGVNKFSIFNQKLGLLRKIVCDALVGKLPSPNQVESKLWTEPVLNSIQEGEIPICRDGVVELYAEINHPGPTSRSCPSCLGGEFLTDARFYFFLNTLNQKSEIKPA